MTKDAFEGFWLPRALRERVLAGATWETAWLKGGAITTKDAPGAVAARWPRLAPDQWSALLAGLQSARSVGGREVLARWQAVLEKALAQLIERSASMLPTLAACTGYSADMLAMALGLGDLISPHLLSAALEFQPAWSVASRWKPMPGLHGRVRFFPRRALDRFAVNIRGGTPMCRPAPPLNMALGYAAGNVPGTALMIALLSGLANCAWGDSTPSPAVLVRNSRHEPLFAPWVLSVVEELDPALVAGLAVLIWDYEDEALQRELMRHAGLMIAAAGDETIATLDALRTRFAPTLRFHRHGHKVSFAVIGNQKSEVRGQRSEVKSPISDIAFLAALDSTLWDQNGCLSARVHFVEGDADEYAQALTLAMRALATALPRGATPRRFIHRAFDTYTALASSGQVRVHSAYDDDFAVIVDARTWDGEMLRRAANACQGRVIVVRPINDVLDVPDLLRWLPADNLQSVSVAMDEERVFEFAEAAGGCGVTGVRSLGRAAFPQLAYSWDGLLPLDVGHLRSEGHFTTVEFDDLQRELKATAERWKTE
jgi:Acyl-CoA reductase (LuxC)